MEGKPPKGKTPRGRTPEGKTERPSAEEIVRYRKDRDNRIATITLDRADELNAMTVEAVHRYADLVRQANIDDEVKVQPGQRCRSSRAP
jgi:1,4-dihydroxy-2-naphthoyl-CoA synthase